MRLNGRDYPMLPDSFLYDLRIELEANPVRLPSQMPQGGVRKVDVELALTQTLVCESATVRETADARAKETVVTWAIPTPDGSARTLEVAVPYTGREDVASALDATQAQAEEMLAELWGALP